MHIFVILIIFALMFYLYYKVKFFRSSKEMERQWLSAKSSIALGAFVFFFGVNQFFLFRSSLSIIIGAIFVVIGLGSVWAGFKAYRFYLPLAIKENSETTK
ncbi:YtpI family protein [Bacillus carboniphilus]|uniref:YtpI family protein n=1 Tax=Bacillus carboniphilus TaxID=86663 RepID=A0ABY9K0G5_9BACI|nr:YtpI family protein [Bacillus carboniphilus]WLR44175.1 YtpI family protein [Bacillus carboniphilus]